MRRTRLTMKKIGLLLCRQEAWCLAATLPARMQWLDGLAVLLHRSDDQSEMLLRSCPGEVRIEYEESPEYLQADFRQRLLQMGRDMGGTHFAVLDADELLTSQAMGRINEYAEQLPAGKMLRMPWIHCWRSWREFRCDASAFGRARVPFFFADRTDMAFRPLSGGYDFHSRAPERAIMIDVGDRDAGLGVLHLQHVVWSRVVAKQKLYIEDEMRRFPDRRTRQEVEKQYLATLDETNMELRAMPGSWWPVSPELLDLSVTAWQERELAGRVS